MPSVEGVCAKAKPLPFFGYSSQIIAIGMVDNDGKPLASIYIINVI